MSTLDGAHMKGAMLSTNTGSGEVVGAEEHAAHSIAVAAPSPTPSSQVRPMPPVERVVMPHRLDGSLIPHPIRYACGVGHIHPSFRRALSCRLGLGAAYSPVVTR